MMKTFLRNLITLSLALMIMFHVGDAYAHDADATDDTRNAARAQQYINNDCKAGYPSYAVTSMLVNCIEQTLLFATTTYLNIFSDALGPTIAALFVFSMILMGIKIMSGVRELSKEVMLYIVKFGLVAWFAWNLGGFARAPFDIVYSAINMVTGTYQPWVQMDLFLCGFFGTDCGGNTKFYNGLMSLVGPARFSSIMGILVFVISWMSVITSVYFIFRAIFTYLASISLIAFIIILSPLFIPLFLFNLTSRQALKWLNYLIAAMLHPVILFAFLYMFLGTMNSMIDWFLSPGMLDGSDFSPYWRNNTNMFSWSLTSDPQGMRQLESIMGVETGRAAVQSFVSPSMMNAVNVNPMTVSTLDFGANQVWAMQVMVFGFLGLFIVSYLMLSMVNQLPRISEAIAGVVLGLRVEGIPFISEFKHMAAKVKGATGVGL